jgi:CHAD domain-containing protein
MTKPLKKYLDKRFKKLTESVAGFHHLHDGDALHRIRIEIKKLKTIINLIHFSYPTFKGHANFIPLRLIFRKAGEIRESEVLYQLLLAYEIDGVADEYIPTSNEADQLSMAFQKSVPQFLKMINKCKKRLVKSCKKVSADSYRDYLKKCKRLLKPLLFPALQRVKLHKARKLIKEIIHLMELSDKVKKRAFFQNAEIIIGHWHDKQILFPLLKKIRNPEKSIQLRTKSRQDLIQLRKITAHYYSSKNERR